MSVIGEAYIALRPESRGFGAEAERGVLGSVSSLAKKAAAILGGAFAAEKGLKFIDGAVELGREANKSAAITAQTIKNTGMVAHVSAGQVDKLSKSISLKTGVDQEQIVAADDVLLRFTQIRNETGKNNDVFNRATKLSTDMARAMGTDVAGAARVLGKALADPAKGATSLRRAGIVLTDQQKEQIKVFTASGRTLDAQKVILDAVGQRFGGVAEKTATSSQKLHVQLVAIERSIGQRIIPVIDRLAQFVADRLPAGLDLAARAFHAIADPIAQFIQHIREGFQAAHDFGQGFEAHGAYEKFAKLWTEKIIPAVRTFATFVKDHLKPILIGLGVTVLVLVSPIVAIVAGLAFLYIRFKAVREIVAVVVEGLRAFIGVIQRDVIPAMVAVAGVLADTWGKVAESVSKRLAPMVEAVRHIIKALEVAIGIALLPILIIWKLWGDQIKQVVVIVFDTIRDVVKQALRVIGDVIDLVLAVINGDWGTAWHALEDIPKAVFSAIASVVEGELKALGVMIARLPGVMLAVVADVGKAGLQIGSAILGGIAHGVDSAIDFVGDFVKGIGNAIIGWINTHIIKAINDAIPDHLGWGPVKINLPKNPIPNIPRLAAGAIVMARPGGVMANIAEAGRNEAVIPLPDGLLSGLTALARAAQDGTLGGGVQVTMVAPPERNAGREVIAELRAVQYLRQMPAA